MGAGVDLEALAAPHRRARMQAQAWALPPPPHILAAAERGSGVLFLAVWAGPRAAAAVREARAIFRGAPAAAERTQHSRCIGFPCPCVQILCCLHGCTAAQKVNPAGTTTSVNTLQQWEVARQRRAHVHAMAPLLLEQRKSEQQLSTAEEQPYLSLEMHCGAGPRQARERGFKANSGKQLQLSVCMCRWAGCAADREGVASCCARKRMHSCDWRRGQPQACSGVLVYSLASICHTCRRGSRAGRTGHLLRRRSSSCLRCTARLSASTCREGRPAPAGVCSCGKGAACGGPTKRQGTQLRLLAQQRMGQHA